MKINKKKKEKKFVFQMILKSILESSYETANLIKTAIIILLRE